MDTSNALRIDANSRQWGGQHHGSDDRTKQRASKLQALFSAIESGELELEKQALATLNAFDRPNVQDADMAKIVSALQDGNIYSAQYFMREYKTKSINAQSLSAYKGPQNLAGAGNQAKYELPRFHRVDIRA
jgi:hypothetical protein